jgi:hypothetical protein
MIPTRGSTPCGRCRMHGGMSPSLFVRDGNDKLIRRLYWLIWMIALSLVECGVNSGCRLTWHEKRARRCWQSEM